MKNILLIVLCFAFSISFSQQKKHVKVKHNKTTITKLSIAKDSTIFEIKDSSRTLYQKDKRVYDSFFGDSITIKTWSHKKPKIK
jgi:hypothetical protein